MPTYVPIIHVLLHRLGVSIKLTEGVGHPIWQTFKSNELVYVWPI
jgi:hypothetical protein